MIPEDNNVLWNFERAATADVLGDDQDQKARRRYSPFDREQIVENFQTLTFPCYALYRAIGVRLANDELPLYGGGGGTEKRDISRKRGINKYFRCILYYKGDLKQRCSFGDNTKRRCNLFVQFFENPSDSMNRPPAEGWGQLRPIIYSNPRAAAVDVVQNYEYNGFRAPTGPSSVEIPVLTRPPPPAGGFPTLEALDTWNQQGGFPSIAAWNDAFTRRGITPPPYEWFPPPNPHTPGVTEIGMQSRPGYRLRPLSNLVTNSGLHLFIIEGTGGKRFLDYTQAQVHPALKNVLSQYISELQRICILSDRANRIRFDLLTTTGKLIQFPPGIRRFKFEGENPSNDSEHELLPLFDGDVTRNNGLLDIAGGQQRFSDPDFPKYSYPSIPLAPNFQAILDMAHRQNVIQSQTIGPLDYMHKPLFKSQIARNRFSDSGHRWAKSADRILKRNQSNQDIDNIIMWLRGRPVQYGPLY